MYDVILPTFSDVTHPKARKEHKCGECGTVINYGTKYRLDKGLCNGEFYRHKMCLDCEVVWRAGYHFGRTDFYPAIGELFYHLAECELIDEGEDGGFEGGQLVKLGMVTIEDDGHVIRPTDTLGITIEVSDARATLLRDDQTDYYNHRTRDNQVSHALIANGLPPIA